jgi:hypothetical protein
MSTKKVVVPKKDTVVKAPAKVEAPRVSSDMVEFALVALIRAVREIASDPSNKLVNVVQAMNELLILL